jgi:hypothetical protein
MCVYILVNVKKKKKPITKTESNFIHNSIETRCCGDPLTFRFHVFILGLKL